MQRKSTPIFDNLYSMVIGTPACHGSIFDQPPADESNFQYSGASSGVLAEQFSSKIEPSSTTAICPKLPVKIASNGGVFEVNKVAPLKTVILSFLAKNRPILRRSDGSSG